MSPKISHTRMILLNVGLLLFFVNVITSHHIDFTNQNVKMVLCGSKLTQAMQFVCKGVYKRTHNKSDFKFDAFRTPGITEEDNTIIDADSSSEFDPIENKFEFRRIRRGISDECCRNSCTLKHLSMYCGRA